MMAQHQGLADGRWKTLTLPEQLGNIGSEVGRTGSWHARGNAGMSERAFERALELLDLTITDGRWIGTRRRELTRAREAFCTDYLAGDADGLASLDKYFLQFALLARRTGGHDQHTA